MKTTIPLLALIAACSGDPDRAAPDAALDAFAEADAGAVPDATPDAASADAGSAPDATTDAAAADAGPAPQPVTITTALTAGVDTPWFVAVGPGGAGEPLRLGPRRGSGYQRAAGTVGYPQLTPDGATFVVVYQEPGEDPVLYALSADGSDADAPVAVATAPGLNVLDRTYGAGQVAFVSNDDLYAASLDGSDAAPKLLASAGGDRIERPLWVTGTSRVAYNVATAGGSRAWTTDGGDPVNLSAGGPTLERVAGVLPGGRVLAYGADDRLYAVPAEGGAPVALTPPGRLPSFEGTAAGRIVVELRTQGTDLRELLSVAIDGSSPLVLTPEPATTFDVAVQRDGDRVAWSAKGPGGTWAAFEARVDEPGAQITGWTTKRTRVTSYAGDVIAGATDDGHVLRFLLPGSPTASAQVVHDVGAIVNQSSPWPVVSADAAHLLYQANTPDGWLSWVTPVASGAPVELEGAWYWDLVTPFGILSREAAVLGAAAATGPEGASLLTPWHEGPLLDAHVAGPWVVYGCEAPFPGWYAAHHDGAGPEQPALPGGDANWWLDRPLLIAGVLVRVEGTTLQGVTLDPSGHGAVRTLLTGVTGRPLALPGAGVAVVPQGDRVMAVPVLGGDPILVLDAGAAVQALYALPGGERVLALAAPPSSPYSPQLLVAHIDGTRGSGGTGGTGGSGGSGGSGAPAPDAVGALDGWVLSVTPTPDGKRVLAELSIEATAVPHPDVLVTATIGVDPPESVILAKLPMGRWGGPYAGDPFDVPQSGPLVVTADSDNVILRGPDGLYSARTDGSEAPVLLGPAATFIGVTFAPDGTVVAGGEGSVTVADPGVAGSQRVVAEGLGMPLSDGILAGDRLVVRAGPDTLVLVSLATGEVTPLVGADVGALLSVLPRGEEALVTLGARLALVPLAGPSSPALVARPSDATDVFVGLLP